MVIGQKTYYKVDGVEFYILDNVTKKPNLTKVFNCTGVISLDTENRNIDVFFPSDTDQRLTIYLGKSELKQKDDGTQYVSINGYDIDNSYVKVFYAEDSITLAYNVGSDMKMMVYYITKI
ncbi:MAG: hypothetical protein GOVbin4342_34 [Prokaryotic dsDNA virus sp.]|nr:MAG: hypothetical protein GOVbin4342_34 [Prokaryotic dsDNA virus sp.]